MIRLFLLFPLLLLSQEVFTLPQEANYFTYEYANDLKRAKKSVYIFCNDINEYSFMTALKLIAKKDIPINIITKNQDKNLKKISSLALLKGVKIFTLSTHDQRKIKGSLSCIDNQILYLTSETLEHTALEKNYSFVLKQKNNCEAIFTNVLKLSSQKQ